MHYLKTIVITGLYSHLFFVFVFILMHFIRPDKSILASFVSEYAVGNYGWLMTTGFFSIAIGALCLIAGLLITIKASKTAITTLVIWCIGAFLFSIFTTDLPGETPTPQGLIHGLSALIALFSLGIAIIAWGFTFNIINTWQHMAKISCLFGVTSAVVFISFLLSPPSLRGLSERILIVWDITWIILVSRQLYIKLTQSTLTF
ncbi:DUF998 domain-containing protein [Mucilaginibacter glaciei]|uniref:DUF998 domain-containing protein n=1 Tax=Mucilaginibacter glaciei TaxID=2772109 RepID=A0A926S3C9_9SPHI|nr:DUF998 domain-containing protein [Mucilaginibacter glaciei]MBD1395078.1 DUF998 domain-containing protein [Mucilaginibacter glaciei]